MKTFFIKIKQLMKFGVVGLSNTAVTLGVYYLLIYLGVNYMISNIIGYFAGSINGYIWSKGWVFKEAKATVKSSVLKYYIVYGSSLILSTAVMYLWVNVLGISDKIAPILTLCITVPYNFIFQKIWAFREKKVNKDIDSENNKDM
jgi:putative flippase GtrA